jgi:hypothetical protein
MKSKSIRSILLNRLFSFFPSRIKQAISKKDEQVQALRAQYETAVTRADHLQELLTQQRKLISAIPSTGKSAAKKAHPS